MTAMASDLLQVAVYTALTADATLGARVTGIYDTAPENATAPYISFGSSSLQPRDAKNLEGAEIVFDLHIWTATEGQMEAKELMALVDAVLHEAALTLAGHTLISIRLRGSDVARQFDPSETLYRARLTYRALVYKD